MNFISRRRSVFFYARASGSTGLFLNSNEKNQVIKVTRSRGVVTLLRLSTRVQGIQLRVVTFLGIMMFLNASKRERLSKMFEVNESGSRDVLQNALLSRGKSRFTKTISQGSRVDKGVTMTKGHVPGKYMFSIQMKKGSVRIFYGNSTNF